MKPTDQQTVLITGSTDGIGKLTARRLAARNARVLIHGRKKRKVDRVVNDIRKATGISNVEGYTADFSSLDNVRRLAGEVLDNHKTLDLLINNAGIGFGDVREISEDGYELRFAVNYLAHFLLTALLLPALKKGTFARIINVSSAGQHPIDFDDLMLEKQYDSRRAYGQSKLALIMFTMELSSDLSDNNITVNSLHPGTYLDTKMVRKAGIQPWGKAETGAEAVCYLATSDEVENVTGKYFDGKKTATALPQAYDEQSRIKLWDLSKRYTDISE